MGTSVQVTPLCGVYNENPLSYLVSIDGFNLLIDCGWNDHFDPSLLQPLSRLLSFFLSLKWVSLITSKR
jgi:cleavage and polyadenylation specificity factor subunit 2